VGAVEAAAAGTLAEAVSAAAAQAETIESGFRLTVFCLRFSVGGNFPRPQLKTENSQPKTAFYLSRAMRSEK
ncbi:MAG: hypothetical protein J7576_16525, partial [Siphonobacter aquaeclarae]|nr:hypothetical protein [Siphonobacter aquaeclarae]